MPELDLSFADTIERASREFSSFRVEPPRRTSPFSGHDWIRVTRLAGSLPMQGWKLHLSATILTAPEVLLRSLPILLNSSAEFKVADTIRMLEILNRGEAGLTQVGKFITVYPSNDEEAVRLARELDRATQGLAGPAVPTERPLNSDGLVHYRYGLFGDLHLQRPTGEYVSALRAPDGELIPDDRALTYNQHDWVSDPFLDAGLSSPSTSKRNSLLHQRYLRITTIHQAPRGEISLAVDLSRERPCVLKSAKRHAVVTLDGLDARDQLYGTSSRFSDS